MIEIRIHGRGGQGNVVAAELLSVAAFFDGRYAQAFPSFGAERTGAPVQAFVRIADRPIRLRSQVYSPDYVIVQDPTLMVLPQVLHGVKPPGAVIVNFPRQPSQQVVKGGLRVFTLPATEIALEAIGRAVPNTTLLGAFCAITHEVSKDALQRAVRERFGDSVGERNAQAVERAFEIFSQWPRQAAQEESTWLTSLGEGGDGAAAKPSAAISVTPSSSRSNKTGSWRTFRPVFDHQKCTGCMVCAIFCPEGIVYAINGHKYDCDYDYCKGCGICAEECPAHCIEMVAERV